MNEKDVRLMRSIMAGVGDATAGGVVLLDVKTTQFVRVELMLLKAISEELDLPGIFISVDRPHQYMIHLLKIHQIKPSRLTFIDLIGRLSGDTKAGSASVGFIGSPFRIDSFLEALKRWSATAGDGAVSLKDCRFVMMDNIATLLTYNSYTTVESLLRNFVSMLEAAEALVPLLVDSERSPLLFETARSLCDREISVREEALQPLGSEGPETQDDIVGTRLAEGGA